MSRLKEGYDALWNHTAQMDIVRKAATDVFGSDADLETQPIMSVEDFSNYLQQVLGTKMDASKKVFQNHHEKFDFHEP